MITPPPQLKDLPLNSQLIAGNGVSTIVADFDFETYSEAGFIWNKELRKWKPPKGAAKKGLPVIGMAAYAEHPSTEVLCLAYDLKNGMGAKQWIPKDIPPIDLFEYLRQGGIIEAWNSAFEYWIWMKVCVKKYGWPELSQGQIRCAAAKARAFSLPGHLEDAGKVLDIKNKKDKDGKRLLTKFSMPRDFTKKDVRPRITGWDDPEDMNRLYAYNVRDIEAEAEISSLIPDLSLGELEIWQYDQIINHRGIQIDVPTIKNALVIIESAFDKYNLELSQLTNNEVTAVSQVQKIRKWLFDNYVETQSLDSETIEALLATELEPKVRRVLEIRSLVGSAAIKKLYAMINQVTENGRLHDLHLYYGARTGRASGRGVQPQNLPNHGLVGIKLCPCGQQYSGSNCPNCGSNLPIPPNIKLCPCGQQYSGSNCPNCGSNLPIPHEWTEYTIEQCIKTLNTGNLDCIEYYWKNAIGAVSGCIRSFFISAPGHDLICSDYSAIEAVVLAMLAGEQWRIDVFNSHGLIYEMSAAKITGIPFQEFIDHKKTTGQHHPMRKKVGKIAELASGYQGWVGAWKNFEADKYFSTEEIEKAILAWRVASPAIVKMWGGQQRRWQKEYFGLEGAAVQAVLTPGIEYSYRGISYVVLNDTLYCRLLSGRSLVYHKPRLCPSERKLDTYSLSFESWNTNQKYGSSGWVRMDTYGGKLTENVVQATARDILMHAIVNLEKAGYPVVLHVHDEIISEIKEGQGTIEEFERIMMKMPEWAKNWPIKAFGGWRAKRYRK